MNYKASNIMNNYY